MQVCLVKTVTDHIYTDGNCVPDFFKKKNICKFNVWSTNLCGSDNNLKMGKKGVFIFPFF